MGFWRKVLKVVGSVPVIGHATAGIQWVAGDRDGAKSSFAASTGNLVGTACGVAGFMCGGPAGAVLAGGAGAALGGQLERKMNGQDLDLSVKTLAVDVVLGGFTAGLGGGAVNSVGKALSANIGKNLLGSSAKTIIATSTGQLLKATGDQLLSKTKEKDPETGEELIRIVTRAQDAKAKEILTWNAPFDAQYLRPYQLPESGTQIRIIRDAMNNELPMVLASAIVYSMPWEEANGHFETAKQNYFDNELKLDEVELERQCNETGQGYEIYPKIRGGLQKFDQLLAELTVLMDTDVDWKAVPHA